MSLEGEGWGGGDFKLILGKYAQLTSSPRPLSEKVEFVNEQSEFTNSGEGEIWLSHYSKKVGTLALCPPYRLNG